MTKNKLKILKISSVTIILLSLIYLILLIIQNYTLKKSFVNYNEGKGADSFVRCNYNILNPKFASAFQYKDKIYISFKTPKRLFKATPQEWQNSYTGGTTAYNLPFPQALQMLKKDCDQFKKSKDVDINRIDSETYWEYTPYTKESEDESYQRYWQEIEKEEKERIRKIESGEIKVKSTYEQLKELGFSEQEIQELMQEMRDEGLKIYK